MEMPPQTCLCANCLNCIEFCCRIKPFENRIPHHDDISDFSAAVQQGCSFCTKVWHHLKRTLARESLDFEKVYDGHNMTRGSVAGTTSETVVLMLVVQWTRSASQYMLDTRFDPLMFRLDPCYSTATGKTVCMNKLLNVSSIPENKSIGMSWTMIESWLSDCRTNHRRCQPSQSYQGQHFVPKRLLRIHADGFRTSVVETNTGSTQDYTYIALSYCWGLDKILKLEKSTIDELYGGISVVELPNTYQDAIKIAHQLHINYVWIDALCIQQDVLQDWVDESASMHKIYGNAILTLSATSAISANHGLFTADTSSKSEVLLLDLASNHGSQPHLLDWTNPAIPLISKSPLYQRGWTLQESLLSRRVLHFTDEQLFWKCNELSANERFPEGFPETAITQPLSSKMTRFSSNYPLEENAPSINASTLNVDIAIQKQNSSDIWSRVISDYSVRRLTNESDKLSALSGLASRFLDRYSPCDYYLAGLWKSCLPLHLLWECDNAKQPSRPNKYQAPSWSPMSLIGKILMMPPKLDQVILLVDLVAGDTVKTSTDTMGPVSGGSLTFEYAGSLIELTQRSCDELEDDNEGNIAGTSVIDSEFVLEVFGSTPVNFDGKTVAPSYDLSLDMGWPGEAATSLHLLPVSRSIDQNLDEEDWMSGYEVRGLVLQPINSKKDYYTRVGMMKAYGDVADLILEGLRDVAKGFEANGDQGTVEKTPVLGSGKRQLHIL